MEHTEIKTIELERKGQEAFREDDSDQDREEESSMEFPSRFIQRYPHLAEKPMDISDQSSHDFLYMGG